MTGYFLACCEVLLTVAACGHTGTGPARGTGDIAFASDRLGQYDVYLMKADGSEITRLTNNPAADGPCAWSPDGAKIAFQSYRDGSTGPDIYVMNDDATGVVRLTGGPGDDSQCGWSPGGSPIVFMSGRD